MLHYDVDECLYLTENYVMMRIEELNQYCQNSFVEHLGIKFTEYDDDSIVGVIDIAALHMQPAGVVHGGVYLTLAETLAGAGSSLILDQDQIALGSTINSQHIASVKKGKITGIATIIHKGTFKHIWDVKITNDLGKLISISRVTNSIKELK